MDIIKYAVIKIQEQQKKYSEDSKEHCIASQIIDIVEEDEHNAELVGEDFSEKTLEEIERKIHNYANKHGGCTPPKAADHKYGSFGRVFLKSYIHCNGRYNRRGSRRA